MDSVAGIDEAGVVEVAGGVAFGQEAVDAAEED